MPDSPELDQRSRLGRTLCGKWRITGLLGEGGTSTVYRATHRAGASVAIKLLKARHALVPQSRARFRREAYVANAVQHPDVVAILDDDEDEDGTPFLVMELLVGTSLETLRQEGLGMLEPSLVHRVALGTLGVLAAAHDRGVVHRDIKPSNLFLTQEGRLKVLDFGVAAASLAEDGDTLHTRDDVLLGTPGFMAPEQARSRWSEVDGRSDLWALGATMFTLLSGEPVHPGVTASERLGLAMIASARSLHSVAPHLPADLVRVVDTALEFTPRDRFVNARAMRVALERCDLVALGRGRATGACDESQSSRARSSRAGARVRPRCCP